MSASNAPNKSRPSARKKARRLAVQALYQWQVAGGNLTAIERQFLENNDTRKIDTDYFHELLHKIPSVVDTLDEKIDALIDRKKEELGVVELAVLRIGAYELMHRVDIPYRVVINEGVELTKMFGAEESFRYINGVLDKIAKQTRQAERSEKKS
ncbi:MAG: transcription antitermination factor NusB [Gammaproteobacteria bacterium]|nr:MAG: transcription antitermination factor NusB [Gammaproteobacteria bacterium]